MSRKLIGMVVPLRALEAVKQAGLFNRSHVAVTGDPMLPMGMVLKKFSDGTYERLLYVLGTEGEDA